MSIWPKVTIKDLLYSYDDPSVTFIKFCFSYSSVMITLNSIFVQSLCPLCANMIHLVSSPVAWPKWIVTPLVPVIPARKVIHLISSWIISSYRRTNHGVISSRHLVPK